MVQDLHVRERPDVFKSVDVAGLSGWFRQTLATGLWKVWIAQMGTTAVGYAAALQQQRAANVFCFEQRWLEIEQIGVLPQFQKKGVAQALIEQVCRSATDLGIAQVQLNTWTFNQSAHSAFERLGFAPRNLRLEKRGW